jgi:hypothetical protein
LNQKLEAVTHSEQQLHAQSRNFKEQLEAAVSRLNRYRFFLVLFENNERQMINGL